jgi:hypothetical protein
VRPREALTGFGRAYADQTEADHASLVKTVSERTYLSVDQELTRAQRSAQANPGGEQLRPAGENCLVEGEFGLEEGRPISGYAMFAPTCGNWLSTPPGR